MKKSKVDAPAQPIGELRDLRKLLQTLWPVLAGCITIGRRPCAYPRRKRCAACRKGKKHPTVYYALHRKGKTTTVYLPTALIEEIRAGLINRRKLEEAILNASIVFVKERKARWAKS